MTTVFDRLVSDDSGQDLIEYALLTTFISLVVVAVFNTLIGGIGNAYTAWNTSANNLWQTPNPAAN